MTTANSVSLVTFNYIQFKEDRRKIVVTQKYLKVVTVNHYDA